MASKTCDGACEEHRGEVKSVVVRGPQGWCEWDYCEAAIETDQEGGFRVFALVPRVAAPAAGEENEGG